jgi:flagellar assembly protein FliH
MVMEAQNIQIKRFDFFALKDFAGKNSDLSEDFVENMAAPQIEIITPAQIPTFSEDELDQAKKLAYQQGINDGMAQAITAQQQLEAQNQAQIANNLEALLNELAQANSIMQEHIKQAETELANLALAAAHKLANGMIAENALPLLQAMIAECLPHILHYPSLKISLNEADASNYWQDINAQISNAEYQGEVQITPNPNMEKGDIKIEWRFGELNRSMQEINQQLLNIAPKLELSKTAINHNNNQNNEKLSTRAALAARAAKLNPQSNQAKEQ